MHSEHQQSPVPYRSGPKKFAHPKFSPPTPVTLSNITLQLHAVNGFKFITTTIY
jgi:hypothetical protein